ncbi:MAG: winged helix-turn-helix domain-containing protein [Planctomycetota bacterium]
MSKKSTKSAKKHQKMAKAVKASPEPKAKKKSSGLDAAAKILASADGPLDCKSIVELAIRQGLWKTGGKTPGATVYAAIIREIAKKGEAARFVKADRGKFTLRA